MSSTNAIGLSSSILHADADIATRRRVFRHGHGLFARLTPAKPLVLLAEADVIVKSIKLDNPSTDLGSLLQLDLEAFRGVHFMATGELLTQARVESTLVGGWLTAWVFLFAHMDARLDLVHRTVAEGRPTTSLILQLHGWL